MTRQINPPPAQLLPCPNPWCENPNGSGLAHHKRDGFRVLSCCGVATPRFPTREEAITAWNTRPPSPERGELASLVEALELTRHVRRMVRAENAHMRGIQSDRKAGREDGSSTSRDDVDMIHADLYAAWPAKRLEALAAALHALSASPGPGELVSLPEAARDLLKARMSDERTVGYRTDLWKCLAEILGEDMS